MDPFNFWYFLISLWGVASEFYILILGAIGCTLVLYALYRGRTGETAKSIPIYQGGFAAGAFGRDLALRMSPNQQALASLIILSIGIGFV